MTKSIYKYLFKLPWVGGIDIMEEFFLRDNKIKSRTDQN